MRTSNYLTLVFAAIAALSSIGTVYFASVSSQLSKQQNTRILTANLFNQKVNLCVDVITHVRRLPEAKDGAFTFSVHPMVQIDGVLESVRSKEMNLERYYHKHVEYSVFSDTLADRAKLLGLGTLYNQLKDYSYSSRMFVDEFFVDDSNVAVTNEFNNGDGIIVRYTKDALDKFKELNPAIVELKKKISGTCVEALEVIDAK